jgi:tetratricopeptide (TPR) repeat protein
MKIKNFCLLFISFILLHVANAQTAKELQETAKDFMRQGDHSNAILILKKALSQDPDNTSIGKDLALSYFYSQNEALALETIKPVLNSKDADDQCFLIAATINRQLKKYKDCIKVYKKGIKAFPESGPLYSGLGEIQMASKNADAIKTWEKGIKQDPGYSKNYYNAAHYYAAAKNIVWSILYAETYILMDPKSPNTNDTKSLLLDNYKTLFTETDFSKFNKEKNDFAKKYLAAMGKQAGQSALGISAEALSMIRVRFIIDWFADASNPTFKVFDFQKQLLKDGLFEAYNQWLFGSIENIKTYQSWIKINETENSAFMKYQSTTIFKMPAGQYYH